MKFTQYAASAIALATSVAAVPAPAVAAVKPLVESNKLRRVMYRSELLKKAQHLEGLAYATKERNRVIGSPGHVATVDWIKSTIEKYPDYYTVALQPFDLSLGVSATLTLNGAPLEIFATSLSPGGDVTGEVVAVKNLACDLSDFPADMTGKIALVFRGGCKSGIKSGNAGTLGAVGMIVYANTEGNLDGYSLQLLTSPGGPFVTTGGITQADGLALRARVEGGEKVVAHLTTVMKIVTTNNINAQTIGGDPDNVIHISGHSDSVAAGPGINDNGSGTISILEVAEALTNFSVNNAVRFSWWSAEESGLLGAEHYVATASQEELDKIRLMLDFDMMASPNYAYQIYDGDGSVFGESGPPGSAEAEKEFQRFFTVEAKENWTSIEFDGRSDYGPFLAAGVATGGIACGAEGLKTVEEVAMFGGVAGEQYDANYHLVGDNVKNLNMGAWIVMTKAIAHMTATYARSFSSLPPRSLQAKEKRMAFAKEKSVMSERATGAMWGV